VAVPSRHNFDREIERGEEIQEGKAWCPGAKEEAREDGEVGQTGKVEKTRSETRPGSDNSIRAGPATICYGTGNPSGHDRRSINTRILLAGRLFSTLIVFVDLVP